MPDRNRFLEAEPGQIDSEPETNERLEGRIQESNSAGESGPERHYEQFVVLVCKGEGPAQRGAFFYGMRIILSGVWKADRGYDATPGGYPDAQVQFAKGRGWRTALCQCWCPRRKLMTRSQKS